MKTNAKKLTLIALFTVLICLATTVLKVPSVVSGYVHLGDAFIILAGIILGPIGGISAAVGSALADLLSGYALYIPATFVIKGLIGFLVGITFNRLKSKIKSKPLICLILGIISLSVMTLGYLAFELCLYGKAAFLNVPFNLIQGAFGIVISVILLPILGKIYKQK